MSTRFFKTSFLLTVIAAAALVLAPEPAQSKEKKEPLEKYRARATSLDRGAALNLDIVIYEWTTPEERQALLQTFLDGGSDKLYDALQDADERGYVKTPRTLAYDMKYAFQFEAEGKRRIVLATDRPFGFLELTRSSRTLDYNVSLVVLEVDAETGEGEGFAMGGAELSVDKKTGQLVLEHTGTQATKLTLVKRTHPKDKKGKE